MSEKQPPPEAPRTLGDTDQDTSRGIFAWFCRNPVAANVIIGIVMVVGLWSLFTTKQEVFPEVRLDIVAVTLVYPGASPDEVEKGVTLPAEEAIRGIDGIKRITSQSSESGAVIFIELLLGEDTDEVRSRIQAAIDRVTTFPEGAEKPQVFELTNRFQVISLVIYGNQSERTLKEVAERAREDLLTDPRITSVELSGVRQREISIEIPQETLRRYRLTLDQVAGIVRTGSIELPAGRIKTDAGEVLIRTTERRDDKAELEDVVVVAQPDGTRVMLGDIAHIDDGFADTDESAFFDGKPAVMINVFRVGDQKPLEVAAAVKEYAAKMENQLPPGVHAAAWFDMSELYRGRMNLLREDALQGLILVVIIIGLFLEIRLAFWVTLGIPVSFLGAAIFLGPAGVSINMLSLFAFILALGSVVDDAINIGESVQRYRDEGKSRLDAAILGVREVAVPVTFAIGTIMLAYVPMLFMPGIAGKFFYQIPVVVIGVLAFSLFESLFILPSHLAHSHESRGRVLRAIDRGQRRVADGLEWVIARSYVPLIRVATRFRYVALCGAIGVLIVVMGLFAGGRVKTSFMPEIESDMVTFEARLPFGTAAHRGHELEDALVRGLDRVVASRGGRERNVRGVFSSVGVSPMAGVDRLAAESGGHLVQVLVYMTPIDRRSMHADELARLWRAEIEGYPGIENMKVTWQTGADAGAALDIQLEHPDLEVLQAAAGDLARRLAEWKGVKDIDDGFTDGKPQLDLTLAAEARAAGLTALDLAATLRAAFFGAEALRLQKGRDEVRVYVRLPEDERRSEHALDQLIVRTPAFGPAGGAEMPLGSVAHITRGRSYTAITRIDGRRAVDVTADVDEAVANPSDILAELEKTVLPELMAKYPQLTWSVGGERLHQEEMMAQLRRGMLLAFLAILALLMIVFKSYVQPLVVVFAIPFGIIGAIVGHMVMGYTFNLMSWMGVIALTGVAINDSLVYVDAINRRRLQGVTAQQAAVDAGAIRARPIILTAVTSFIGLAPLILETEMQARFLIPMAISLGFGIIFSTVVTLLVVPCFYLIVDDIKNGFTWWGTRGGRMLGRLGDRK
jgi:multidrug efflux pump subunit AcrB